MDWKDEEVLEGSKVAAKEQWHIPPHIVRAIMTRAVELATERGWTDLGPLEAAIISATRGPADAELRRAWMASLHALSARNAVLEAEVKRVSDLLAAEQRIHAADVEELCEVKTGVRNIKERLSAAGQVLSVHVDKSRALPDVDMMCGECHGVHPHRFFDAGTEQGEGWRCSNCGSRYAIKHRYPCSPTCTHDDAATPGHPERVKERSEAFNNVATPDSHPESFPARADDDTTAAESDAYDRGAEAMRAACWEAVQPLLERCGIDDGSLMWKDFKSAIEGAAP